MPPQSVPGSLRVARILGIDVFVHWSWAIVAVVETTYRTHEFGSPFWNVAEYLTLFAIVLTHELGHSLACRSVGGTVSRIVLWPLGGIAYVDPPQRPGAMLWSLAAGPLVNVVLVPVTLGAMVLTTGADSNVAHYFQQIAFLNGALLAFNLLPFYPLDGGQIVRSIFWFFLGRARSLSIASAIGLVGALLIAALAAYARSPWLGIFAVYNGSRSWSAWKAARSLRAVETAPRRSERKCPSCEASPPIGAYWICPCRAPVDLFASPECNTCSRRFLDAVCLDCHARTPLAAWDPHHAPRDPDPEPLLAVVPR